MQLPVGVTAQVWVPGTAARSSSSSDNSSSRGSVRLSRAGGAADHVVSPSGKARAVSPPSSGNDATVNGGVSASESVLRQSLGVISVDVDSDPAYAATVVTVHGGMRMTMEAA